MSSFPFFYLLVVVHFIFGENWIFISSQGLIFYYRFLMMILILLSLIENNKKKPPPCYAMPREPKRCVMNLTKHHWYIKFIIRIQKIEHNTFIYTSFVLIYKTHVTYLDGNMGFNDGKFSAVSDQSYMTRLMKLDS